ncbi:response regulator transcription factor [Paenibacillus zeirhizosphaerae]|uniref:response regulator transcription factor n=1 Tax=Paenibacillus zeirhizosphaerae TaxID=2987519 RepID=UPI0035203E0F
MKARYQVVIADDEPIIREGIRDAVNWEELGMSVLGEVEDGEEALELALDKAVDIMLVDMNMPFMDGIELIRRLRSERPGCRFVVISGHDEFAFAQEALRLGVEDYLLKPMDPKQLHSVLSRVGHELDEERRHDHYIKLASEQIDRNIPLLRQRFCQEWMEGLMAGEDIVEKLDFLRLPNTVPAQIGVIRWPAVAARESLMKENDRQLFLFAAENISSELLAPLRHVIFHDQNGLIGICLWEEAPEGVGAVIEREVGRYLNIAVQAYFGAVTDGMSTVPEVYRSCREQVYRESRLSPLVRRARQLIGERYADPEWTLEAAASRLQVSPVYLSRVLKKELHTSFVSLVSSARIAKAVRLLDSTSLPMHEIALLSGYESQHYFSTAFKKRMGVSPNQYRKGSAAK